jgi:hypothetical protein
MKRRFGALGLVGIAAVLLPLGINAPPPSAVAVSGTVKDSAGFEHDRLPVLLHAGGVTRPDRRSALRIRTRSPHSIA